jgi:hypothetical protein
MAGISGMPFPGIFMPGIELAPFAGFWSCAQIEAAAPKKQASITATLFRIAFPLL